MMKITDEKFINYFESNFRKLDLVYEELLKLNEYSRSKTVTKITNSEAHNIGSVVFNLESGINQYSSTLTYKFEDLINSIISSINIKSYSSSVVLTRAFLEHFGMFALKTSEYEKYILNDNFLKLSKEFAYWGIGSNEANIAINHKRTHIMDAIRYLNKYFFNIWNRYPEDKENFFEEIYDQFSNFTHPASDSLLIYLKDYDEKWNSSGYEAKLTYSKDIDDQHLYIVAYIFNLLSNFLVSDLFPKYYEKVVNLFESKRDKIIKFFSLNPEYAKEILDLTINKQKIDEKRQSLGLDDIDKMRYANMIHKKQ